MKSIINQPTLYKQVNHWLNIIQYSLLPARCILCETSIKGQKDLCKACETRFIRLNSCCSRCATSFASHSLENNICGNCQKQPPAFDKVYAPFVHQGNIRHLINDLKFNNAYKNARLLAELLAQHISIKCTLKPELIIPMPLHPQRYRERGFNQSLEIAKIVSQLLKIPYSTTHCQRIKNTAHQINLTGKQREQNIKQAFKLSMPIKHKHIVIIDDVMTTGATANELAKIFKTGGVKRVDIWVCSRR